MSRLLACLDGNTSLQTLRFKHAGLVATDLMKLLAISLPAMMDELVLRRHEETTTSGNRGQLMTLQKATNGGAGPASTTSLACTTNRLSRLN